LVEVRPALVVEMPVEAEPPAAAPPVEEAARAPVEATPPPRATKAVATPSAPAAARAGRTLVADAVPSTEPDVADFTLVQGTGDAYAGGTTSARGTADRAVAGPASDRPSPPTAASPTSLPAALPVTVDRARAASPGGGDWSCSRLFPSDPDAPDHAAVTLVVEVDASGHASRVHVTRDPGHGFAEAARRCAAGQTFTPALDAIGQVVAGKTRPFVVRFSR
jgi:hypothetical protein